MTSESTALSTTENASPSGPIYRLGELYRYRELLFSLVIRELKARYKNSILGFVWSLLSPLGMMLVFTFVFGFLMPNRTIENFPIFLLCGILPWNFFAVGIMASISAVVGNANLVKKVYFPREILPISVILAHLVNFLLALLVLFAAILLYGISFSPWLGLLPVVILIQTCFMIGISFFLSATFVYYRDTIMVMDVVILAWFFLSPVFYSVEFLPRYKEILGLTLDIRRLYYILNPVASLINLYRDMLFLGHRTDFDFFLRTTCTALVTLVIGYWFFIRLSGRFGEEV